MMDGRTIDVRNEVSGVGTTEYQHLAGLVGLGLLDEGDEIADQLGPEQVHWRGRDLGEEDTAFGSHPQRFELRRHCCQRSPVRNGLKAARNSDVNRSGCSHAAKWPPRST